MASTLPGASSSGAGDVSPTGSATGPAINPKMRKRTKTGCLTCRKRRIKCGEERPTCANCIKSKRQCEGYNQRVVFKPPMGDWPNHPGVVSTLQYHNSMLPGTRPSYRNSQPSTQPPDPSLSSIQPRPQTEFDFSNVETGPVPGLEHLNTRAYPQDPNYQQPLPSPHHQIPLHSPHHPLQIPVSTTSYFHPHTSPAQATFPDSYAQNGTVVYEAQQRYAQAPQYQQIPTAYDSHVDQKPPVPQAPSHHGLYHPQPQSGVVSQEHNRYLLQSYTPQRIEEYPQQPEHRPDLRSYGSSSQGSLQHDPVDINQGQYASIVTSTHPDSAHSNSQIPQHYVTTDVKYPLSQHAPNLEPPAATAESSQPQLLLSGFAGPDHVSPTQILDEAAVEYEDDDYYDVQSDEEMLDEVGEFDDDEMATKRNFSLIQRIHRETTGDLDTRGYDSFIYDGILSQYRTEHVANPLKNPKTARVFAHFIYVTGPSLSIYERNPRNPSSLFGGPSSPSHQSLWTSILPLKALNNQALLHAMLALASLHIAKLQKASVTPSYKHYAYALKRLGRYLGNPKKRLQIPTLATALLLAYYEVMTAEHVKWSTHLVGAAQLLAELDFRTLTQDARRQKAAQAAQDRQFPYQNPDMLIDQKEFEQRLHEATVMPDERLVGTIVGKKLSYDDFGRVLEEGNRQHQPRQGHHEKMDLRTYETFQDLYWFYCRQDAFQSIISGNPLIMPYRKWSDCPPRAPIGRVEALVGTHDHLILLMGRIAEFLVRDRERKLRQVEAWGGSWRPTPGMPGLGAMGPPPSQGRGQPPTPAAPMGPPPHMQGMGPPPGWTGPPPPGWQGQQPAAMGPPSQQPPMSQGPRGGLPPTAGPGFYGMAPSRPPIALPSTYANPDPQYDPRHSPQTPHTPHPKFSDLPAAYDAALADWNSISAAHATVASILSNTPTFAALPASDFAPPVPGQAPANMTPFGPVLMHSTYDISTLWMLLHLSQIILLRSHPAMPPAAMVAASICAPATQPYATLIGRIAAGLQLPTAGRALTPILGAALIESTMSLFFAGVQYRDAEQRAWLVERLLEIDHRTGWASASVIARSCETSWERAAQMGKGPPYEGRKTKRAELMEMSAGPNAGGNGGGGGWGGAGIVRNAGGRVKAWEARDKEADEDEKRFVVKYDQGFVPWAMNLLATEQDLRVGMERVGLNGEINVAGTEREREKVRGRQEQGKPW
ncbi:hypothetical protein K491DRAFT_714930 [Lophiostoma macrostomum CBS 122681]|uniref:Zn(2)-C6 fungal-type domain-containing protein n=1 Tax=Lophiostoma macrostomum CBS 122681 TaxID=1314788 RepID=A0A6A6TE16_9PLEO|nr:hypothetical protein K491DRAFT_714930 [Lophiostoma macrostomum CBS 122681]